MSLKDTEKIVRTIAEALPSIIEKAERASRQLGIRGAVTCARLEPEIAQLQQIEERWDRRRGGFYSTRKRRTPDQEARYAALCDLFLLVHRIESFAVAAVSIETLRQDFNESLAYLAQGGAADAA